MTTYALDFVEAAAILNARLVDGDLLVLLASVGNVSTNGTRVSGGSYANQPVTWNAAGGYLPTTKASASDVTFDGMPSTNVFGWEIWDATLAARKWLGFLNANTATATASTDTINCVAHGLTDGAMIVAGITATPMAPNTIYYVVNATADNFQIATTLGGTAEDVTADFDAFDFGVALVVTAGESVAVDAGQIVARLQ